MATTEQFSLRWNNFHSNIASGFHDLLEAADLVDVTLAVEGQFLHAHKLVLSICSPYFKEMFKQNPCKHPIIILKDVTHKNLKDILEFMYLGEVNVLRENLPVFLRTAELLQVKGLSCDDTQSNSSKSSGSNSNSNIKMEDDQSDLHEAYDDYEENIVQMPVTNSSPNKRSKHVQNSNAKKVRNAVEELSNLNQKQAAKDDTDEPRYSESPVARSNDYEGDDLSMEFKQNNDSGVGFMNNSNNSEIAGQEQGGVLGPSQKFKCKQCGRAFTRRDHLKTHEKNIHGDAAGPFACKMCAQYYKNAESLRKHVAKFHLHHLANKTVLLDQRV
ncbi:protein tramtrack, beta isoform-like isoform X3 [Atheta coriaria]|uniref:protein tramtrack, beta isoform-like isoform X3 n=1 Tax=Dalotia coriaria TaxID=877792 RepID=UPI0031F4020D